MKWKPTVIANWILASKTGSMKHLWTECIDRSMIGTVFLAARGRIA
jgi:hypothetical protein